MREKDIRNLLAKASLLGDNSELEFEIFDSIFNLCLFRNYKIENYLTISEDCSICEQQKFIHLVALEDEQILDLVYEFHKTYSNTDFCKEEFKSKFELQLIGNSFEIHI